MSISLYGLTDSRGSTYRERESILRFAALEMRKRLANRSSGSTLLPLNLLCVWMLFLVRSRMWCLSVVLRAVRERHRVCTGCVFTDATFLENTWLRRTCIYTFPEKRLSIVHNVKLLHQDVTATDVALHATLPTNSNNTWNIIIFVSDNYALCRTVSELWHFPLFSWI